MPYSNHAGFFGNSVQKREPILRKSLLLLYTENQNMLRACIQDLSIWDKIEQAPIFKKQQEEQKYDYQRKEFLNDQVKELCDLKKQNNNILITLQTIQTDNLIPWSQIIDLACRLQKVSKIIFCDQQSTKFYNRQIELFNPKFIKQLKLKTINKLDTIYLNLLQQCSLENIAKIFIKECSEFCPDRYKLTIASFVEHYGRYGYSLDGPLNEKIKKVQRLEQIEPKRFEKELNKIEKAKYIFALFQTRNKISDPYRKTYDSQKILDPEFEHRVTDALTDGLQENYQRYMKHLN